VPLIRKQDSWNQRLNKFLLHIYRGIAILPIDLAVRQFCPEDATVLDCANGYQKESKEKEEVDEVEEDCRREGEADQKANEKSSGEGSEEEICAG
jgi:hypothetical protein